MTDRELLVEGINKLFVYTDSREWNKLIKEVFDQNVYLDMSTVGTQPMDTGPEAICDQWAKNFEGLDALHHQGGNYLISVTDDTHAEAFAYAIAIHYKKGVRRDFVGSYRFKFIKNHNGWRIYSLVYDLKLESGNPDRG